MKIANSMRAMTHQANSRFALCTLAVGEVLTFVFCLHSF
jgi:hypothetical protein